MGKSTRKKTTITKPDKINISKEEEQYRHLFDFAHYLENLQRGPVPCATQLLRTYLANDKNITHITREGT